MKTKKTYDQLIAEGRARAARIHAEIESHPDYAKHAAEWDAEYEAGKGTPEYEAREAKARLDMEEAVAYAKAKRAAKEAMQEAQKLANLTQREIARRMGISQPAVSAARQGAVSFSTLWRFFDACDRELIITSIPKRELVH